MVAKKILNPKHQYEIVVVDEAQHVTTEACRRDNPGFWEMCCSFAHAAPKVLLLSATPALHHEQEPGNWQQQACCCL